MPTNFRNWTSKILSAALIVQMLLVPAYATAETPDMKEKTWKEDRVIPSQPIQKMTIGKARYEQGEKAEFQLSFNQSTNWSGKLILEFYLVNEYIGKVSRKITVLQDKNSDLNVTWQPPKTDFRGYLVKAYIEGNPNDYKTAAVDVSSDWTHFPRYGYTTEFPKETAAQSEEKIKQLSQEYYLNGYQFYDWMWRHDVSVYSKTDANGKPLRDKKGNFIAAPYDANTSYADLLGRHLYPAAVKQQVEAAQKYGSSAMAYQMNYAAREIYEDFGVKREWGLYNKNAVFPNPDPLKYQNGFYFDWVPSALYLQDPGNPEWQAYITKEFNRSVNAFGFNGIHLDQWGASDNDFLYDYNGKERYFSRSYDELINAVKDSLTKNNASKNDVTFNMVGGNGGYSEVPNPKTKTDFDYSEIWTDKDNYRDVKKVIADTKAMNGGKAMVIAGYMNYKQAVGDTYGADSVQNVPKTVDFISRINKVPGWVGDFGKKDEDQIIWTVNVETTGEYDLVLNYGHDNGGGNPEGRLTINGQQQDEPLVFDQKTGWGNPVAKKIIKAPLQKGDNNIVLQLNTNDLWLNVDSLVIDGQGIHKEYEAEYAQLISCKVDKYGHVYFFETEGDYVTFRVKAEADGEFPVHFRYSAASAPAKRDLIVNDVTVAKDVVFAPTGNWEAFKDVSALNIPLKAGDNTVTLKLNGTTDMGMKLDYLQVGADRYEAEKSQFGWKPAKSAQIQVHPESASGAFIKNIKNAPDSVEFDLVAQKEGSQEVVFHYASANSPTGEIYVNGTKSQDIALAGTGGWGGEGRWAWKSVNVPVHSGTNTVRLSLTSNAQYLNLDGILTDSEMILVNNPDKVVLTGGIELKPSSDQDAKTDNHNGAAAKSVSFKLNALSEGDYTVGLWYRTGTDNTSASISVGDATPVSLPLSNNGWYDSWWGLAEQLVHLKAGENIVTVKLASESTYINLHALSYGKKLEAEGSETRTNGVTKGTHWLDDFGQSGDYLSWTNTQTSAGDVALTFTYRSAEALSYNLEVNGVPHTVAFEATDGAWGEKSVTVPLQSGDNTLKLVPVSNQAQSIEIDGMKIGGKGLEAEDPSVQLGGAAAVESMSTDVGYLDNFTQKGDYFQIAMRPVAESGMYDMNVFYRSAGEPAVRSVYLNGKKAGSFSFPQTGDKWSQITIPVYLASSQPANTLIVKMEQDSTATDIAVDRVELDGAAYQAEAAELGWQPVVAKTGEVNFSLGKTDNHGTPGQTVIFNIDLDKAANELVFKYRSGNDPKFDVIVDGTLVADDIVFGATPGGWDGGMVGKSIKAPLSAGKHKVELVMVSGGQYVNLDSLAAGGREYEAEDAQFAPEGHGIQVSSGTVTGFGDENDFLTFELGLTEAQIVNLGWRFNNQAASRQTAVRALYINGVKQSDVEFSYTGDTWTTLNTPGVALQAGTNKITLRLEDRDDEGIELDYLDAGSIRLHAEKADATPAMIIDKDLLLHFGHTGDEAVFPIDIEQAGETSLIFTYSNAGSTATKTLYIDGQPVLDSQGKPVQIGFSPTANRDSFNEDVYYIVPYLSKGAHTVTLKHTPEDKGTIDLRSVTVGFFNDPSVRLMDAVLAAMGATHIELGTAESIEEGPNMLAHEYYPNRSKKMKASLKGSMKEYYKFFAAYENLLFDSKEDPNAVIGVKNSAGQAVDTSKDGSANTLLAIARKNNSNKGFERYDVLQLVNLLNNDENWRNAASEPQRQTDLTVTYDIGITKDQAPNLKVYTASPDHDGGMLGELSYQWEGTKLRITVPSITYWEMLIIDRNGKQHYSEDK